MEYILDGYNIIKYSAKFQGRDLETARNKLIDFICANKPQGNNNVTIAFDCRNKNPYEAEGYSVNNIKGIKIMFSEGGSSADDIIVGFVENSRNPYEITVVTNDRGIHRRIGGTGAKKESVDEFLKKGFRHTKQRNNTQRMTDKDNEESINVELSAIWLNNK